MPSEPVVALPKNGFPALANVCAAPDQFLGRIDVAHLNLMCAGGLPGAECLDIGKQLEWLDEAASKVDLQTRHHWYRFLDSPGTFNNSPGYFCCYLLLQVLQEDCGVKYNPARVTDPSFQDPKCLNPDFRDSCDLFIHGIIDGPGGTCVSMPVIYVAVGRRLGYPLKLVETRGHLFFRWDAPVGGTFGIAERFNIEGAGYGIASYSDEHYEIWPEPWLATDKAGGWFLKSLSPAAELASFLATRGECLKDLGRIKEAIQAYRWAADLVPEDLRYATQLVNLLRRFYEAAIASHEHSLLIAPPTFAPRVQQPNQASIPPHGDSCRCLHCQQARETKQRDNLPGHPSGCACFNCRQHSVSNRQNPFSPW